MTIHVNNLSTTSVNSKYHDLGKSLTTLSQRAEHSTAKSAIFIVERDLISLRSRPFSGDVEIEIKGNRHVLILSIAWRMHFSLSFKV